MDILGLVKKLRDRVVQPANSNPQTQIPPNRTPFLPPDRRLQNSRGYGLQAGSSEDSQPFNTITRGNIRVPSTQYLTPEGLELDNQSLSTMRSFYKSPNSFRTGYLLNPMEMPQFNEYEKKLPIYTRRGF